MVLSKESGALSLLSGASNRQVRMQKLDNNIANFQLGKDAEYRHWIRKMSKGAHQANFRGFPIFSHLMEILLGELSYFKTGPWDERKKAQKEGGSFS